MEKKYLESSEFYSKRFNNFSTIVITPITLIIIFVLIFSFFGKREITIEGIGTVEPKQEVSIVQSSSPNIIRKNNLSEGKQVHKHDLLLLYSSKDKSKLKYYKEKEDDLESKETALSMLKQSVIQNKDIFTNRNNFGYHALLKGYLAQRSILLIENQKVSKQEKNYISKNKEINYTIQENNAKLDSLKMQQLEKIDRENDEIHQNISEVKENIRNLIDISKTTKVRAPKGGVIHINEQYRNAQYIPIGSKIAEIYPILNYQNYIKIKSYISVTDISSIKKGQKIRFKVTRNVPKPIILTGRIKNISVSPVNIGKNTVYLITSVAKVSKSTRQLLKYGMVGTTSVITGNKTIFEYYKEKFLNKN